MLAFLAVGTIVSALGAREVAHNDGSTSRQVFLASAAQISSTLQQAIVHEQDLTISTGAVMVRNPDTTEADFLAWTNSVRAFARYPEVQSISNIQQVQASQLAAYAARQVADPSGPLAVPGTFAVTPAGVRPYYCLASVSLARTTTTGLPDGVDFCQSPLRTELLQARDSGKDEYLPYKQGEVQELAIGSAIYQGGVVPATVAGVAAAAVATVGAALLTVTTVVPVTVPLVPVTVTELEA